MSLQYGDRVRHAYLGDITSQQWSQLSEIGVGTLVFEQIMNSSNAPSGKLNLYRMLANGQKEVVVDSGLADTLASEVARLEGLISSMFNYMGDIDSQSDLNALTNLRTGYGYRVGTRGSYSFIMIGEQSASSHTLDVGDMLVVMEVPSSGTATPSNSKFNVIEASIDQQTLLLTSMVSSTSNHADPTPSTDAGRYYKIELNAEGNLVVNVPWFAYATGQASEISSSGTTGKLWAGATLAARFDEYLPLAGGRMSGDLVLGQTDQSSAYSKIAVKVGNDELSLLRYEVVNSVGTVFMGVDSHPTKIYGSNSLVHRKNNTDYTIWDADNLPLSSILSKTTVDSVTAYRADVDILASGDQSVNIGSSSMPFDDIFGENLYTDSMQPLGVAGSSAIGSAGNPFTSIYGTDIHASTLHEGNSTLAAKYLAKAGGSMSNTNLVTNMNADLLDSKHLTDIMADVAKSNVATATNLKVVEEKGAMFTYRNTPTAAKVAGDVVRVEEIRGQSIVWNQLVPNNRTTEEVNGITYGISNGVFSFSGTATAQGTRQLVVLPASVRGHKIFLAATDVPDSSLSYRNPATSTVIPAGTIYTPPTDASTGVSIGLFIPNGYQFSSTWSGYLNIIDLTAAFGSDSEPTADEFKALYDGYHANQPGAIKNLSIEAFKSVGFNKWDEAWKQGGLKIADGTEWDADNRIISTNYIRVQPNTDYYFKGNLNNVCYYDANKTYIEGHASSANMVLKTPVNCYYIRIETAAGYGIVYNHDVCVNISDATRNGTYEPYHEDVVELNIGGGFNRWDGGYTEQDGQYLNEDGTIGLSANYRVSGYIRVEPNTAYYLKNIVGPQASAPAICWYNASKTLISGVKGASELYNKVVTAPANACYLRCSIYKETASTACVNISDPTRNGTYKPYKVITGKNTAAINPISEEIFVDGMMGINGLCDSLRKYDADVVMDKYTFTGNESWSASSAMPGYRYTQLSVGKTGTGQSYVNYLTNISVDNEVQTQSSGLRVFVVAADNAAAIAATMGKDIIYQLATPIHYILDEPLDLTAYSDALGTQSILPIQTGMAEPTSAPIVADLKYGASAFDLMEAGGSYDEGTEDDVDELRSSAKVWSGKTLHDVFLTRDDYMLNNIAHWDQSAGGELGLLYFYSDVQVGSDSIGGDGNLTVLGALMRKVGNDILDLDNIYLGLHAKADSAGDADYLVSGSNKYNVAAFARKAEYPFLFDNIKSGDSDSNPAFDSDLYVGMPTADSTEHDLIVSGKVKEGGSWLEDKYAAISGNIATATNLKTYTETGAMFTHRAIPAEGQHGSDMATINEIRGKSLVWNQLSTLTTSINLVKSTARTAASASDNLIDGHKYIAIFNLSGCVNASGTEVLYVKIGDGALTSNVTISNGRKYVVQTLSSKTRNGFYWFIGSGSPDATACTISNVDLHDMTAMGMASLDGDEFVAWLDTYYQGHHSNDGGSIKNLMATGVLSEGFNQFNESTLVADRWLESDGSIVNYTGRRASSDYFRCIGGDDYFLMSDNVSAYAVCIAFYDANKTFISRIADKNSDVVTAPSNACYFRIGIPNLTSKTCINRSSARNGQYEPYRSYTMPLPITTMTGKAGGVGESVVIYPDGMMSAGEKFDYGRVGADGWWRKTNRVLLMVNLGDLSWSLYQGVFYSESLHDKKTRYSSETGLSTIVCSRYTTANYSGGMSGANGTIYEYVTPSGSKRICIVDSAYSDAQSFRTAMKGVYLVYELASPVEYILDTPIYMGYPVDADGTETMQPDQTGLATPTSAPLCCDIQYGMTQSDIFSASRYLEGTAADIANQTAQAMVWSGDTLADTFFLKSHLAYVAPSGSTKGYLATESNVLFKENGTLLEDKYLQTQYLAYVAAAGNVAAHLSTSLPLWTSSKLRVVSGSDAVEMSTWLDNNDFKGLQITGGDVYFSGDIQVEDKIVADGNIESSNGYLKASTIYEGNDSLSDKYLTIQDNRWITSL